jgi:hypothetical protein
MPKVHFLDERIRQEGDSIPERRSREWTMGLGIAPVSRVSLRASYGERVTAVGIRSRSWYHPGGHLEAGFRRTRAPRSRSRWDGAGVAWPI